MAKTNDRVVLIKGDNSKWYEQAIFIIKKGTEDSRLPVDFVLEAEKIIDSYMRRTDKGAAGFWAQNGKKDAALVKEAKKPAAVRANAQKSAVTVKKKGFEDYIPYIAMIVCCLILGYIVYGM
ncbi:MAG: hypothetical protein LBS21_16365 [Clostridiales bacterium]|jgi:hypothetical protein|nr:hypothetical protein [Clostridiales bacterium]